MAIARASGNAWLDATTSAFASVGKAFANNVTAGSLLVAVEWFSVNETQTIADNNGNTWTSVIQQYQTNLSAGITIWYAKNAAAGATTVTASSASTNGRTLLICEYTGADTASPVDGTAVGDQANGSASNPDPGAITTSAAGVLIGAAIVYPTTSPTAGTNYTRQFNATPVWSSYNAVLEDWLTPSAQTNNHPNWATSENYWLALGAGFKQVGGSASIVPGLTTSRQLGFSPGR
jgi:hypothetical protein